MARPGVDLHRPVTIPLDVGRILGQGRYDALDFTYPGPALTTSWGEILSSALRVGRAGWVNQIRVAWPARYEAGRRVMHLLSHLDDDQGPGHNAGGLIRSAIFENEDGSEKTFSSYAIGMALCQTFATNTLRLPALAHFDMIHGAGGTRPDLVHPTAVQEVFVEAKGRYRRLQVNAMTNAVNQLFAHAFAPTMIFGAATAACFDNGNPRLSMHCRVWNPTDLPYDRLAAMNDGHVPAETLSVVAAHLLGAAGEDPQGSNGLFISRADNRAAVCAREPTTGLILGLTEEDAARGWEFLSSTGGRKVDVTRLLDDARSGNADPADRRSSGLKLIHSVALGWPDAVKETSEA